MSCRIKILLSSLFFTAVSSTSFAQQYPVRPIKIVVPFGAGNSSDVISRIIAVRLSTALGGQVYVENHPGAGAIIGTDYGARAAPDGYTLVFASTGPMAISPALQPALVKYDPIKDFTPIAALVWTPQVLVVPEDSPFKDIQSLVHAATQKPGEIFYGSGGTGTTQHLMMSSFASAAHIKLSHIPYTSANAAITDLIAKRVAVLSDVVSVVLPQIRGGRIRPIGVTTDTRLPQLPNVPTIAEQGIPFNMQSWNIMQVPAGTPPAIVARLSAVMKQIQDNPEVQKLWFDQGFVPMQLPPEKIHDFLRAQGVVWKNAVDRSGAKIE
jgi:tripartite-type tricarboxylate transporter receptor subunit TctC